MNIVTMQSGYFSDIDHLNPNFRKDFKKLKITLDTPYERGFYLQKFPVLLFTVMDMLPNLRHHRCSHGDQKHIHRQYDMSHLVSPIKIIGDVIDTVHLLEHTILELQCQISEMEICSGLTCNYWEPENRYDVFVECTEPDLAIFSAEVSVATFNRILEGTSHLELDLGETIRLARTIYKYDLTSIRQIARRLSWSEQKVIRGMEELEQYRFPFRALQPAA